MDFKGSYAQKEWESALWHYEFNKRMIITLSEHSPTEFVQKEIDRRKEENRKYETKFPILKG